MAWIEALQRHDALWAECKEFFETTKRRELDKVLSVAPDRRDEQIGVVKGVQLVLDAITAKEREAYARTTRPKR